MKHGASEVVDAGCYTMSVIVRNLPRAIRVRLFKIVFWLEQERIYWSFIKTELRESLVAYGWEFGVGDFVSKLEFWDENSGVLFRLMDKKAYRRARRQLAL